MHDQAHHASEAGHDGSGRIVQRPCTGWRCSRRCLTAFYTFRAFFLTFYGEERIPPEAGHHAHESPRVDDRAAGHPGDLLGRGWRLLCSRRTASPTFLGSHAVAGIRADRRDSGRAGISHATSAAISTSWSHWPASGWPRSCTSASARSRGLAGQRVAAALSRSRTTSSSSTRCMRCWSSGRCESLRVVELLDRPLDHRRPGEPVRQAPGAVRLPACARCRSAWCSFTPWRWCWACSC